MDSHDLVLAVGEHWFLASISEPSNNDLRILIVEGKAEAEPVDTKLGPAFSVRPESSCRAYELTWWRYIAYNVRNESFTPGQEPEPSDGRLFGVRASSAYLDYVARTTWAKDDYPGPLTHWYLRTEWHCLDVVSDNPPAVREAPLSDDLWGMQTREPSSDQT